MSGSGISRRWLEYADHSRPSRLTARFSSRRMLLIEMGLLFVQPAVTPTKLASIAGDNCDGSLMRGIAPVASSRIHPPRESHLSTERPPREPNTSSSFLM